MSEVYPCNRPPMKTSYFTFGYGHRHILKGTTWDHSIVCKITAEDPREVMMTHFGTAWSFEYPEMPQDKLDKYYPRGIQELKH